MSGFFNDQTLTSAWDNLVGGLGYTGQLLTGNDHNDLWARSVSYNQWMLMSLPMWQTAPSELLTILQKQLSDGTLSIPQYNDVINRRNRLYTSSGLPSPSGSTVSLNAPSIKDQLPTIGKNIANAGKDVVSAVTGSATDAAVNAVGSAVNQAMGIPVSYIVLAAAAVVVAKIIR